MAGKNGTFPAQKRNAVVAQFTAAIQVEPDPSRKAELAARMGPFQASLVGMTGAKASDACIAFIRELKAV